MSGELNALPTNWRLKKLGDFCKVYGGKRLPKGHDFSKSHTEYPYIRVADFNELSVDIHDLKYLNEETHKKIKRYTISNNDVYVSIAGSIGKVGTVPESLNGSNLTENAAKLTDIIGMDNKFLSFALSSPFGQEQMRKLTASSSQPKLALFRIKKIMVPFPPLAEQKRIVAAIEGLKAENKITRNALDKVPILLRRFRQSVLAKAFRGELTRRDSNDENAQKLLEKIKKEPNNRKKLALNETQNTPMIDLPKLPESWVWTQLGSISENNDCKRIPIKDKDREKMKGDYPYYGASGIIDHVNDYIFDGEYLLIGEDGANLVSRSTPIAFIAKGKFWVNNHAHILKTFEQIPLTYIEAYFNSISLTQWVTGTAQPKLTQGKMNFIPIPLAPLGEQKRIVAKIQELFSFANYIETQVKIARQGVDKLDQAILIEALKGELVSQDLNDEPSSVLLQKIRAAN